MKEQEEVVIVQDGKATAKDLFDKLAEVMAETFVATYEKGDNVLIMRIVNGQKFRISVEEM